MSALSAESPTGARARRLTLVAMSIGFAVVQLDVSVLNVAVRAIGADLGGAVSEEQWVLNAYTIGFAAFILTAGALGDRIGARRVFTVSAVIGLLANLIIYGLIFLFSLYFQTVQGHTPLAAGLALLPYVLAAGSGNVLSARLARRLGPVRAPALSAALLAAGCLGLVWIGRSTPYPALVAPFVCLGIGLGTLVPLITSELMGSVERSRSGVAAGTLNTMRQTGSAIGVAWFGSLLSVRGGFIAGLHLALVIGAALALSTALLSTRMEGGSPRVWRARERAG